MLSFVDLWLGFSYVIKGGTLSARPDLIFVGHSRLLVAVFLGRLGQALFCAGAVTDPATAVTDPATAEGRTRGVLC